jgi:signal transduction histidine kinase
MTSRHPSGESIPELLFDAAATRPVLVPRVLVFDDDAEAWAPVVRALRQAGQGVLVSDAAQSAVELVTACEAEVAVVKMGATGLETLDLIARIRRVSPETEIIVIAGDVAFEDAVAVVRQGAFDVIRRPLSPCSVVPVVLRAIATRKKARDTAALLREGQRLLLVRERERLPALIVDFARKGMRADVVSLMLRDTTGRLYIAHAHGLPADLLATTRLRVGQRIAGRIAEMRAPVLVSDATLRDPRFEDVVPFGRVRSSIVYPLLSGDRLLGVLNIGRSEAEEPYSEPDLARAGLIVSQALQALEGQRHWQRTGMADRLAIVGQVASSVAHEINNPLSAISGQHELALESIDGALGRLERGASPAAEQLRTALNEIRRCIEDAQVATASMLAVASDLRLAAQSEQGEAQIFELGEAIRAAVRLATAELRRRIAIVRRVESGLLVEGDPGRLCQVFLGLLLHANQSLCAAATAAPEIRIDSTRIDDEFRIDVTDNGPGIAAEELAQIFEPFYADKGSRAGFGLGLSIASDIVQGLGGRIEVRSKVGQGTSFSVYLPAAQGPPSEADCRRTDRACRTDCAA